MLRVNPEDINNDSFDNCAIGWVTHDSTSFTCGNVGTNTTSLATKDVNGNSTSRSAIVIVEDKIEPVVIVNDINAKLVNGVATLNLAIIDN